MQNDEVGKLVDQIVDLVESSGESVDTIMRKLTSDVMIASCLKRMSHPYGMGGKIIVMSTPHSRTIGDLQMQYLDDLEDDQVNLIKAREVGEYNGFRFLADETVPPGMSPSFHHIMQKQRKKKGKK